MCADLKRLEQDRASASQKLMDEPSAQRRHEYRQAVKAVVEHLAKPCQECRRERMTP